MNCKKIRDLILTDYRDGELSPSMKKKVDGHLEGCAACREFFRTVQEAVIAPFQTVSLKAPPEFVWYRIKDKIAAGQAEPVAEPAVQPGFLSRLFSAPVPVYAVLVAIVLISGVLFRQRIVGLRQERQAEHLDYYASLIDDIEPYPAENGQGYGTLMEDIFL